MRSSSTSVVFRVMCVVVITACAVFPARAGTIRHDVSDTPYKNLANETRYDASGHLEWLQNGLTTSCSATLIHPEWVLTGGHCVDGTNWTGGGISGMIFELGANLIFPTVTVNADSWAPHPQWSSNFGNLNVGYDIGLVHLDTPILSVEPAKLFTGTDELGLTGTLVGYGRTGTGSTGDIHPNVVKRAGDNVIDNFGGDLTAAGWTLNGNRRITYTDFDTPTASPPPADQSRMGGTTPLDLEYAGAIGDSGAGLFVEYNGQTYLVGVDSFGSSFDGLINSDYGDANGFTRVAVHLDWVRQYVPDLGAFPGDLDVDGDVDLDDFSLLALNMGTPSPTGDLDGDGQVNLADFDLLASYYGSVPPIAETLLPEPAGLLWFFGLAMGGAFHRRRADTR